MLTRLVREERGFTIIELLVVMVLMGVVGSVATAGIVTGMRTTRQAQARVEALAELQKGAERITREIRVADGSDYPPGTSGELLHASEFDLQLDVYRNAGRSRFRYWRVTTGGVEQIWERREIYDDPADAVPTSTAERVFIDDLANGATPVFTYLDAGGSETDASGDPVTGDEISRVALTLVRDLPEQDPVSLQTVANLRNAKWRYLPLGVTP